MFFLELAAPLVREEVARWLYHGFQAAKPHVAELLADPAAKITRVGDALVWSGSSGQRVIGGLEMLADSHQRIESAVNGIETAQLATQGVLGAVRSVSIATLGVTSLTGALMTFRLQALNKRVDAVGKTIKDVEGKIDAEHKAYLKASLQYLREYDDERRDEGKLHRALDDARHAANIYGEIANDEAHGAARLPVLNCRGRLYILSLLTELRCLMSCDNSKQALDRIDEEESHLSAIAKACFDHTMKNDPERYLRKPFMEKQVNLDLVTHVYQQAKQLGIIDQPDVDDACGVFELMRERLVRGESYPAWWRRGSVESELIKLRYLLACLEETSRVKGLKLMITEVQQQKGSLSELVLRINEWRLDYLAQHQSADTPLAFAFAL